MDVAGIIAEYNPFHNGHQYQLNEVRRRTGADYIVVVMSGDFVQRGEPAIVDKYRRTRMALEGGADLVLELPVCLATGSAEYFAMGGVSLLDRLGVVDTLCFGSESGDLAALQRAAKLLLDESESFRTELKRRLTAGISYPQARAEALEAILGVTDTSFPGAADVNVNPSGAMDIHSSGAIGIHSTDATGANPIPAVVPTAPNDILAVEYLKALNRTRSVMEPLAIRRQGQGYHCDALADVFSPTGGFASASAIRHALMKNPDTRTFFPALAAQLPAASRTLLADAPAFLSADSLSEVLNTRLLQLLYDEQTLSGFADLSPELAARLKQHTLNFASFSGRIQQLKTRSYTYTRISRALLHLLLGITDKDMALIQQLHYAPYARILGFRRSAGPLLHEIKKSTDLVLVTKTADAAQLLTTDRLQMLNQDFHASHLYQSLVYADSGQQMKNEYTRSVVIL
ncbi:MAG: nucleotidyltransferase family protein [Clostridiales bacterium]|nr:nucleotidyltransferase family protein [Clostridiales bacterium]